MSKLSENLYEEVRELLNSLANLSTNKDDFKFLIESIGWDSESIFEDEDFTFVSHAHNLLNSLEDIIYNRPKTIVDIVKAVQTISEIVNQINDLFIQINPKIDKTILKTFAEDFLNKNVVLYIKEKNPVLFYTFRFFDIFVFDSTIVEFNNKHYANYSISPRINFSKIKNIFSNPLNLLDELYFEQGFDGLEKTNQATYNLFNILYYVIAETGIEVMSQSPETELTHGLKNNLWFRLNFYDYYTDSDLGIFTTLLSNEQGGPGISIIPNGILSYEAETNGITTKLNSNLSTNGFNLTKNCISFFDEKDVSASINISIQKEEYESGYFLFGVEESSHIYVKDLILKFYLEASDISQDAGVILEIGNVDFLITTEEADSFINKIVPSKEIKANFELILTYSFYNGIYFEGSGDLKLSLPLHLELGIIEVIGLTLELKLKEENLSLEVYSSVKTTLGPLQVVLENIGLSSRISFPESGFGKLGLIDFDIAFKPPTGIAISIDSNGFTGGGFLDFYNDKKEYSGGLELEFNEKISLKVIGILTTLMPDGSNGFSLLLIITSEFNPIQLGFGFTLNGVGGLIGINRTCEVKSLQTGIKDGTLDNILFPQDIVQNANQIVTDVKKIFPVMEDQYVFGPMVEIGWGSPTIITVQLGLVIEAPDPVRLYILGVLKALLPDENFKLLSLQVNFLGILDLENSSLSFDASLFESKLLNFELTGSMALRVNWGSDPAFILSVGGFNESYKPPANAGLKCSDFERLSIELFPSSNPTLRIETYFAVTSNTVQFGVLGELYVGVSKFSVEGMIGFDVLFQFSPFYFEARCKANMSVSAFGEELLCLDLNFTLSGPTPWHAYGKATFKIGVKSSVNIDTTFGDSRNTLLESINVEKLVIAAITNIRNWEDSKLYESNSKVTIKKLETSEDLIINPVGILKISQKVAPLDLKIEKFGSHAVSGNYEFKITEVVFGKDSVTYSKTKEEFAPAQYFEFSDNEKLSKKDFEEYNSGISIDGAGELKAEYTVEKKVEYEFKYLHKKTLFKATKKPDLNAFNQLLKSNATSKSPLSYRTRSASVLGTQKVKINSESFVITNVNDLLLHEDSYFNSEREAIAKMNELVIQNPKLKNDIQVMPAYGVTK